MEPLFYGLVIGAVVGAGITLLWIYSEFEVIDKERWKKRETETAAAHSGLEKAVAENAKLRVALAAAEMTEDAKKVAAMTLAALNADIATANEAA